MLRIAICDDEKVICQQIEDILADISENINEKFEIELFYSGEELCEYLFEGNSYDLIFLDIELCEMNGVEVGRKIREEMNDESTQIVYVSGKESYAMDLFEVRPLNFLVKPANRDKIELVVIKAIKLFGNKNHFFEYKNNNINFSVPLGNILYFESDGRKVNIVLIDET
ncbi:MAG: LytR/AlgR family response regulator transcription factor, partial [Sedimentibacter sp.]